MTTTNHETREGPRSCRRCGGRFIAALILGHVRYRCPEETCERARERRRAQQARSAHRIALGDVEEAPARRTVRQMRRYYDRGPGFREAVREAMMLLVAGESEESILEAVGFPPLSAHILEAARAELRPALVAAPSSEPARITA